MRARNIKPGFFKNEELSDCDPMARLLFIGLWCIADREGRLEYREKRIKAEVFPYDDCDVVSLIDELAKKGFILIYSINNENFIQIINFLKHQNCHIKEQSSTIQAPCLNGVDLSQAPYKHQLDTIQARPLTESPLLNPESPLLSDQQSADFLAFWKLYPNKTEKKYTYKCWKKLSAVRPTIEVLLAAIRKQIEWREKANGEFRPEWKNPATWLNKGCWDDELKTGGTSGTNTNRGNRNQKVYSEQDRLADEINAEYYRRKAAETADNSSGNT